MKCVCISCLADFPPFENSGDAHIEDSLLELLQLLKGLPQNFVKRVMRLDHAKLAEYEESIVKHLQRTDGLHPTEVTIKLQFFLMQIWHNQYAICAA